MRSFFSRLKCKFRIGKPLVVPRAGPTSTETSPTKVVPNGSKSALSPAEPASTEIQPEQIAPPGSPPTPPRALPERLWDEAHEKLRESDAEIVDAYERVLSGWLSESETSVSEGSESADEELENKISPNVEQRREQMQKIVKHMQGKAEKHAETRQKTEKGIEIFTTLREVGNTAVKASPEAALAWGCVCCVLEILMNPSTEAESNHKGMEYVVIKMEWYSSLSKLLLDGNLKGERPQDCIVELRKAIIQLYAKLLLYQMKSVCYQQRSSSRRRIRGLVKLDGWESQINDIKDAERALQNDINMHNTTKSMNELHEIANTANRHLKKLSRIESAIEKQNQKQEENESEQYLMNLFTTDPAMDKKRIERTKGGLIESAYRWVLSNDIYQQWIQDQQGQLLWVKGDAGKGKTMLLCGIINELEARLPGNTNIAYFFCQGTDIRINNVTAVLRGLLYMILKQQPEIIRHLRNKYAVNKESLEGPNAWVILTELLTDVLQYPRLNTTYLVIDAVDECTTGQERLLQFLAKKFSTSCSIRWLVSSRNYSSIQEVLEETGPQTKLSLEMNKSSVTAAVEAFIQLKVDQLARKPHYNDNIRSAVFQHLMLNAEGTFLWVALVCQELEKISAWNVLKNLSKFPAKLENLYKEMVRYISTSEHSEICRQILATYALLRRPVTILELVSLVEPLAIFVDNLGPVEVMIGSCGSFFTIEDNTVRFVHQSAKDFLIKPGELCPDVFPDGAEVFHREISSRSLALLSETLRRNMYQLEEIGGSIDDAQVPESDPLVASRYSCVYWIDHLCDSIPKPQANGLGDSQVAEVTRFMEEKYLYWLEGLSLCKSVPTGMIAIEKLSSLAQEAKSLDRLNILVEDARRLFMYHRETIKSYPLQTYASALLFSPTGSIIRRLFQREELKVVTIKPAMSSDWSACLQTLEGHKKNVNTVTFSDDSTKLASASSDHTVRIWDPCNGETLQVFRGHTSHVNSVAFSHDSTKLASASADKTIRIWDASTVNNEPCLQILKGHTRRINSVAFSHDSTKLVSGSVDGVVKIWDLSTGSGKCLRTIKGHTKSVFSVAFSHDSTKLASASADCTSKIWDTSSGTCLQKLEGHSKWVSCVVFSRDSTKVATGARDKSLKIWDVSSGECLKSMTEHGYDEVLCVAFSPDSSKLASGARDSTVKIWDASRGECIQTLMGHSSCVNSVAFSNDSTILISGGGIDCTIKIWDAICDKGQRSPDDHTDWICTTAFSRNSTMMATGSSDATIKLWDATNCAYIQTLKYSDGCVWSAGFSHDATKLVSGSSKSIVYLWDLKTGECLRSFHHGGEGLFAVAVSDDSTKIASASECGTVKIWGANDGTCLQTLAVYHTLYNISFDSTGSHLYTDIGPIAIDPSDGFSNVDTVAPRILPHPSVTIGSDRWIAYGGKNMVRIPSEFYPSITSVRPDGHAVGAGVGSGRVWICSIGLEED